MQQHRGLNEHVGSRKAMASPFTHPAVPIVAALLVGRGVIPAPLAILGISFSMLPDLDVIAFRLGVPYGSPFGHRGFSHSIVAALLLATAIVPLARALKAKPSVVFWFLSVSMLSHGILDAFTRNATNGVALFWPFSAERILFSFRPIEASPISLRRFMSERGLQVLWSEMVWVWAPLVAIGLVGLLIRRHLRANKRPQPTRETRAAEQ